jgi:hypothetical protein
MRSADLAVVVGPWIGLLLLVACTLALLALPVEIDARFERRTAFRYAISLRALLGLVSVSWTGPAAEGAQASRRTRVSGSARTRRPRGPHFFMGVLRNEGARAALLRLCMRVTGGLGLDRIELQARIGLDDPADTGLVFGAVGSVCALAAGPRLRLELVPDFDRPVLQWNMAVRARPRPLRLMTAVASFFTAPAVIAAWRAPRLGRALWPTRGVARCAGGKR